MIPASQLLPETGYAPARIWLIAMGTYTIAPRHLRFAIKLACAVVLALFVGFHFQLETPRWAVLTAAIVAAGPAFAAGGEPYSGAIRYRGMLRIAGTFIGCIAALVIIILMIRAPLLMMLVCCLWAGFVPGFRRWSRSKTPMPGAGRVHRADYHYYHPYQSDAGAAVCCRTLQRNCHRYCQRHRRRSPVFAAFD